MAKSFELVWLLEELEEEPSFMTKRMFGGLSIYLNGLMVLLLAEDPGNSEYRGVDYGYEIWNGLLLPTFHEHHDSLLAEFPALKVHPVLGKWLYLPQNLENFEDVAQSIIGKIGRVDPRFGIVPGSKGKSKKKKTKKKKAQKKRVQKVTAKKRTKKKVKKAAAKKKAKKMVKKTGKKKRKKKD